MYRIYSRQASGWTENIGFLRAAHAVETFLQATQDEPVGYPVDIDSEEYEALLDAIEAGLIVYRTDRHGREGLLCSDDAAGRPKAAHEQATPQYVALLDHPVGR